MKKIFSVFAAVLFVSTVMAAPQTVSVKFGSASVEGATQVNNTTKTFTDANSIEWTLEITNAGAEDAAIQNAGGTNACLQIGSAAKPAAKVVIKGVIATSNVQISDFNATFGGAAACNYSAELKIDGVAIANGSMAGNTKVDVKPESSWAGVAGKELTIEMTNAVSANMCVYNLSYTFEATATDIENVVGAQNTYKTIYNGQVVIVRDGVRYNTVGQVVE